MGKRGRPPKKHILPPTPSTSVVRQNNIPPSKPGRGRKRKFDVPLPNVNLINLIGNCNVKSFLTVENFEKLPLFCRKQLLKLLPECDRTLDEFGKPKLAPNALNNEYFTHHCLDFKERLLTGALTPEGNTKDNKLNRSTLEKLDPWKLKHFERYFGEKLKNVDPTYEDLNPNPRKASWRKASIVEPQQECSKVQTCGQPEVPSPPKRPKGRPRKNPLPIPSASEAPPITSEMPPGTSGLPHGTVGIPPGTSEIPPDTIEIPRLKLRISLTKQKVYYVDGRGEKIDPHQLLGSQPKVIMENSADACLLVKQDQSTSPASSSMAESSATEGSNENSNDLELSKLEIITKSESQELKLPGILVDELKPGSEPLPPSVTDPPPSTADPPTSVGVQSNNAQKLIRTGSVPLLNTCSRPVSFGRSISCTSFN